MENGIFIGMKRIIITESQAKELARRLVEEETHEKPLVENKLNLFDLSTKSKLKNGKKNL
jgi:hypothetical protein